MLGPRTDKTWKVCDQCGRDFTAKGATTCPDCQQYNRNKLQRVVYSDREVRFIDFECESCGVTTSTSYQSYQRSVRKLCWKCREEIKRKNAIKKYHERKKYGKTI